MPMSDDGRNPTTILRELFKVIGVTPSGYLSIVDDPTTRRAYHKAEQFIRDLATQEAAQADLAAGAAKGPQALTHKERATVMFDEFAANPVRFGPEIFERHLQAHTQALQQKIAELERHLAEANERCAELRAESAAVGYILKCFD